MRSKARLIYAVVGAMLLIPIGVVMTRNDRQSDLNHRLQTAIHDGNVADVSTALSEGADPNRPLDIWHIPRSVRGAQRMWASYQIWRTHPATPLLLASTRPNSGPIVALLLDHGARPNEAGPLGSRPLLNAAVFGNATAARELLNAGATMRVGNSPASTIGACIIGMRESHEYPKMGGDKDYAGTLAVLLDHGADVNCRPDSGRTLLMEASQAGDASCIAVLLKYHANTNLKDPAGRTAHDYARMSPGSRVLKMVPAS